MGGPGGCNCGCTWYFMQVSMDGLVHVRLTREMVRLLLEIDHEMYEDCMTCVRWEVLTAPPQVTESRAACIRLKRNEVV